MTTSCFRSSLANGAIAVAGLLMAGCAPVSRQALWHQGQTPPPSTYTIVGVVADKPAEFAPRLSNVLEEHGFREADYPRYLVQIAHSDRPGKIGLPVPEARPTGEGPPSKTWKRRPRRNERVRQLTISISGVTDGQELYRVQGTELYRPGKADDGGVHLMDMMMAHIAGQSSVAAVINDLGH